MGAIDRYIIKPFYQEDILVIMRCLGLEVACRATSSQELHMYVQYRLYVVYVSCMYTVLYAYSLYVYCMCIVDIQQPIAYPTCAHVGDGFDQAGVYVTTETSSRGQFKHTESHLDSDNINITKSVTYLSTSETKH